MTERIDDELHAKLIKLGTDIADAITADLTLRIMQHPPEIALHVALAGIAGAFKVTSAVLTSAGVDDETARTTIIRLLELSTDPTSTPEAKFEVLRSALGHRVNGIDQDGTIFNAKVN